MQITARGPSQSQPENCKNDPPDQSTPVEPASPPKQQPTRVEHVCEDWWVEVAETESQLSAYVDRLKQLADSAAEPNVFYEPWFLLPSIKAFGQGKTFRFVFVFCKNPRETDAPILCGFMPLVADRLERLGLRTWKLWSHDYNYLCTPLLKNEQSENALQAFFKWAASTPDRPALLDFSLVNGEGPFAQGLVAALRNGHHLSYNVEQYTRAMLRSREDWDSYFESTIKGRSRRDLARLKRRLGEIGQLELREITPNQNPNVWIDEFLELEAAGWKGRNGTAIGLGESHSRFFRELALGAFEHNQLQMLGLYLDGEAVALKCNLLSGSGGFAFKIAFNEQLHKYSPGVQLEIENARLLHCTDSEKTDHPRWMDSCAVPTHFMINRLWKDRRVIQRVLISTGRLTGDAVTAIWPLARFIKKRIRRK